MLSQAIIDRMVKAIEIKSGSTVLLHFWGDDMQAGVLQAFACAVACVGASPLPYRQSREGNAKLFACVQEGAFADAFFDFLKPVDVVIDIMTQRPVTPSPQMPEAALPAYRQYMRTLSGLFMQKEKFAQIRVPTVENALDAGIEPEDYIARMTAAYDIDYDVLKAACVEKVEALAYKKAAVLRTGNGNTLQFSLQGRQWHIDAGDGDFPCGEVYIAPVERDTNGSVHFQRLMLDEGECFDDVTLTIKAGAITGCSHEKLQAFLGTLPENGNIIGELGIGMNEKVTALTGYTVLDEKMAGTFHIGLGMNLPFGGENGAASHIDLVGYGDLSFA